MRVSLVKHIIDTRQLKNLDFLDGLFERADFYRNEKIIKLLHRGKIVASLFYEPSTRTKLSFDSAANRLGANVIGTENAKEFSSAIKGESLEHSILATQEYYDVIVIRHPEGGAAQRAAKVSRKSVINAGDGNNQHPTQSLLDVYTIKRELGRLDDLDAVFVGDMLNARTARSLVYLLAHFKDNRFHFVTPTGLGMKEDVLKYLDGKKIDYTQSENVDEFIKKADVVYATRVQKERFSDSEEFKKVVESYSKFIIDRKRADSMKKGAIIMHPLPINSIGGKPEISPEVDFHPRARYFKQSGNGLFVRMALLDILFYGQDDSLHPIYKKIIDLDQI